MTNFASLTAAFLLLLGVPGAHAQETTLPTVFPAGASASAPSAAAGTTATNPFDIPETGTPAKAASSSANPDGRKTFYRAGKEAAGTVQSSSAESAEEGSMTEEFPVPEPEEFPAAVEPVFPTEDVNDGSEEGVSGTEQTDPAEEPAGEESEAGAGVRPSAPERSSFPGGLSGMMQYAGIAVACGGAAFLFFFRKKRTAVAAPAVESAGPSAPVDSNRVKKALASFHTEPAAGETQPVAEPAPAVDSGSVKAALADFHEKPAA